MATGSERTPAASRGFLSTFLGRIPGYEKGVRFVKESCKKFRENFQGKEELSPAALQERIDTEREKFRKHLNLTEVNSAIQVTLDCLEEFNEYHHYTLFNKHVMEEFRKQFVEKYIIIGVVGRYNSGKSTLLNGLLHSEVLPTDNTKETAWPILLKHNPEKHFGGCPSHKQQPPYCQKCPELTIEGVCELTTSGSPYLGRKAVTEKLRKINVTARDKPGKANPNVTLEVYIPMMKKEQHDGIRVYFRDTPGFGAVENKTVKDQTAVSVLSTSLLIYATSCKEMEDETDAETLRMLCEINPDIVQHGRIIIAATHFDELIWPSTDDEDDDQDNKDEEDDNHEEDDTENTFCPNRLLSKIEEVKTKVRCHFAAAAGLALDKVPDDIVVPLSLNHAVEARIAMRVGKRMLSNARGTLEHDYYVKFSMGTRSGQPVAEELDSYSQMPLLEEKLRNCLMAKEPIWLSSILSSLKWHLETSKDAMERMLKEDEEPYQTLRSKVDCKHKQGEARKSHLTALMHSVEQYKEDLESHYDSDFEVHEPQMRKDMETAFKDFRDKVMSNFQTRGGKEYTGKQYDNDLELFLQDRSKEPSRVLKTCRFDALDSYDTDKFMKFSSQLTHLVNATDYYCSDDFGTFTENDSEGREKREKKLPSATFDEVQKTSEILKSHLNLLERIRVLFLNFFRVKVDLQKRDLSEKGVGALLDKSQADFMMSIESYFPQLKQMVVKFYLENYSHHVTKSLNAYHAKNDKRISAQNKEVEKLNQQLQKKKKVYAILEQEKRHCIDLREQLCRLQPTWL